MGCAASSQPASIREGQSTTAANNSAGNENTRGNDDKQPVDGTDAATRGGAQNRTETTAAQPARSDTHAGATTGSSQAGQPPAIAAFTTHVITDGRGCRVTTVIQNRNKVETLCKWVDHVIKARSAAGGVFNNPQDGRRGRPSVVHPTEGNVTGPAVNNDTASVSSRQNNGHGSRTEYGSMVSNGNNLLGASTTAHGASQSHSRGNLTMVAQHGSEEEGETAFTAAAVDPEESPSPLN